VISRFRRFIGTLAVTAPMVIAGPTGLVPAFAGDDPNIVADAGSFERLIRRLYRPPVARPRIVPRDVGAIVNRSAARHGIPPSLILAVIRCESAFDTYAVSRAGARGLMQVLPRTAAGTFGMRDPDQLFVPEVNIELGTAYLRLLADRHRGNVVDVLSAYNAGSRRVDARRIPRETRAYVHCVHRAWRHYAVAEEHHMARSRGTQ